MQTLIVGESLTVPKNLPRSEKRSILTGMVLGDGHLRGRITKNYTMVHGVSQREYIYFKKELLEFCLNQKLKISYRDYYDKRTEKTYGRYCCHTKAHAYFKHLYDLFYIKGKKTITRDALEGLTPLGIAVWYMDDGSMSLYKNKYKRTGTTIPINAAPDFFLRGTMLSLYTTLEQANTAIEYFKEKWGIGFKLRRQHEQYSIEANVGESKKFIELIRPYIIPSMEYKIDLDKRVAWYKAAQALRN